MLASATAQRSKIVAALIVAGLGVFFGWTTASAECRQISLSPTLFDPAEVCTGAGEDAQGTVAVSLEGDSKGSPREDNPSVALSGNGDASHALVAVSVNGRAGTPQSDGSPPPSDTSGLALSLTGDAYGIVAASGTGDARGLVGVSGTGDSRAQLVAVSLTGRAGGQTWTGDHPGAFVAVSGCEAEHYEPHSDEHGQLLTADPSMIHVNADLSDLLGSDGEFEPTDVGTGPVGPAVKTITCPV